MEVLASVSPLPSPLAIEGAVANGKAGVLAADDEALCTSCHAGMLGFLPS